MNPEIGNEIMLGLCGTAVLAVAVLGWWTLVRLTTKSGEMMSEEERKKWNRVPGFDPRRSWPNKN